MSDLVLLVLAFELACVLGPLLLGIGLVRAAEASVGLVWGVLGRPVLASIVVAGDGFPKPGKVRTGEPNL